VVDPQGLGPARAFDGHMNLQLFADPTPGAPAGGDPAAAPAAAPAQYTPEQIESWKTAAEGYSSAVAGLQTREQEIAAREQQLQVAAQLDQLMRTDPNFREALQRTVIAMQQGGQPPAAQPGYQSPDQLAASLPPQLLQAIAAQQGQLGQLGQTVQSLQESQRRDLIMRTVESARERAPFAQAEEILAAALEYPNANIDALITASNAHWEREFQAYEARMQQQRQKNALSSSLGPSGGPAAPVDKAALATASGRRSAAQDLARLMAQMQNGG